MSEFDIIKLLAQNVSSQGGTALGIGDDAALLEPMIKGAELVEAVEIVSFSDAIPYQDNILKLENALERFLERLSTAGTLPTWLLTSICLDSADQTHIERLEICLRTFCQQHNIHLIGGDISRGHTCISLRLLGKQTTVSST